MVAKLISPMTVAVVRTVVTRMIIGDDYDVTVDHDQNVTVDDDQSVTGKTADLLTPGFQVPMTGGRVLALLLIRQGLIPIHVLSAADKQTGYSSAETDHIRLLIISEWSGGSTCLICLVLVHKGS